jgi:hypothetical protein
VLATPLVQLSGPNDAQGIVEFTLYDGLRDQHEGDGPLPLSGPVSVGEFHDTYRRTADGWKITAHRSIGVFRR